MNHLTIHLIFFMSNHFATRMCSFGFKFVVVVCFLEARERQYQREVPEVPGEPAGAVEPGAQVGGEEREDAHPGADRHEGGTGGLLRPARETT